MKPRADGLEMKLFCAGCHGHAEVGSRFCDWGAAVDAQHAQLNQKYGGGSKPKVPLLGWSHP